MRMMIRSEPSPNRTTLFATILVTLLVGLFLYSRPGSSEAAGKLRVVGFMDSNSQSDLLRMLVDPDLNLGVTIGNTGLSVILYDLSALQPVEIPYDQAKVPLGLSGITANKAALDEKNHRVFFAPGNVTDLAYSGCAGGPRPNFSIGTFDLLLHRWASIPVQCSPYDPNNTSGRSSDQFRVQGIFYYAPADRLYVSGTDQTGFAAREATTALKVYNRTESSLLVRQMDPSNGHVDWELDLRRAGCDRMVNQVGTENVGSFVARYGNSLYSYCYGIRTSTQGDQGFAVKIPLDGSNHYLTENGEPVIKLTPTLPNDLFPMLDPATGSILMLTSGPPNGDAVWVYDPEAERFVGVIASGISAVANQSWTAAGLDEQTGRTYMLSTAGLLVADARHRPLPAGLNFNINDPDGKALTAYKSGPMIAVAPKLHRLFLPYPGYKFAVIEDGLDDPVDPVHEDLDAGTANIPEVSGKTISSYAGAAAGFGSRLLITGGATRAINNLDYTCYNKVAGRYLLNDQYGRCLADQLLTGGTRDLYLGVTKIELGSQTGAVGYASGAMFASADTASDRDLKRIASCYSDIYKDRVGQSPPAAYSSACAQLPFSRDFGSGTRGPYGAGAPIPSSNCSDFGGAADAKDQPSAPAYASLFGSSHVECKADARLVTAQGWATAFSYPAGASPTISIGRTWSTTSSQITGVGTLTTIESVATGVNIGPYSIGRISMSTTTKAHGIQGTSIVNPPTPTIRDFYASNGQPGCVICDYKTVIAEMNKGLGLKMRVTQPQAQVVKSDLGYQSYVIKDPAARESDRAANNDDTFIVPALQITLYNDGFDGRNRFILQLAGVQAQSLYGIVPVPEVGQPTVELPSIEYPTALSDNIISTAVLGTSLKRQHVGMLHKILRAPVQFVQDSIRLIVHNPREFFVLFLFWLLFATPFYLWLRRRSLVHEVSA